MHRVLWMPHAMLRIYVRGMVVVHSDVWTQLLKVMVWTTMIEGAYVSFRGNGRPSSKG